MARSPKARSNRRARGPIALCTGTGIWLAVSAAYAHPAPAEPPDFGMPACITVVDKRTTDRVDLSYLVGFDDTVDEPDHIPVPDQKTHQFYAFRGQLTGEAPTYYYWPFDPTLPAHIEMPLWIDQTDLAACAAANTPMIAPDFSPEKIGADTLAERPELAAQWLSVRDERVPITELQGLLGLRWPLADVAAGVYQVAAYIYSPPFNAWEPRPGVIKVIDDNSDVPAVTVDSVDAMLFEGQGRKVGGCVNAPVGSELRAYYRAAGTPEAQWQLWATQPVDDSGRFELCYRSPSPGFSDIVDLQVVAVSPDGQQTAAYPPDQVVLIPAAAKCTESTKLCCDDALRSPPAAGAPAPAGDVMSANGTGAEVTGNQTQPEQAATPPAATLEAAAPSTSQPSSGGCTILDGPSDARSRDRGARAALALVMLGLGLVRSAFRGRAGANLMFPRR